MNDASRENIIILFVVSLSIWHSFQSLYQEECYSQILRVRVFLLYESIIQKNSSFVKRKKAFFFRQTVI